MDRIDLNEAPGELLTANCNQFSRPPAVLVAKDAQLMSRGGVPGAETVGCQEHPLGKLHGG